MSRLGAGILAGGGVPGNDAFTKILLHMDGANGGTSFPDVNAAATGATWTPTGTCTTTTSAFKFGTASYQGAASSYIRSNVTSAYNPGSGDFSIDFWLESTNSGTQNIIALEGTNNGPGGASTGWNIFQSGGFLRFGCISSGVVGSTALASSSGLFDGNWHHIECTRSGNTLILFFDGTSVNTASFSSAVAFGTFSVTVGGSINGGATPQFNGNLDEVRYSVGIARHTANFTPPTGPYS